ncbi:MAG: hypothetical protein M1817_004724 [Caeruleum heppii]|nr:MAG: hypothetical protein M1817_004724 [Caeruleum heppii]
MAPQSRGKNKTGQRAQLPQSVSTPTLPTFTTFQPSPPASPERTPTGGGAPSQQPPSSSFQVDQHDDADFQSHYASDNLQSSSSSDSDITPITDAKGRHSSLPHNHSSFLGPNPFAPPFYNRPPTPLPPSPSLTSLLRPTFSTTNSRPTTPDSSDQETPNDTEAVVAKSARTATTVPRASPRVPTYEYYGFVLYLGSSLVFREHVPVPDRPDHILMTPVTVMYLLWSYLPSPFLHQLGINYYPDRWWSLAIPAFLVMLVLYIYVALASYNTGYLTLPMSSIENIVDEAANIAAPNHRGRVQKPGGARRHAGRSGGHSRRSSGVTEGLPDNWRAIWDRGTDAVMDVPIAGVCELLYGQAPDIWDDSDRHSGREPRHNGLGNA